MIKSSSNNSSLHFGHIAIGRLLTILSVVFLYKKLIGSYMLNYSFLEINYFYYFYF